MSAQHFLLVHLYDDYSGSPKVLSDVASYLHENNCSFSIILGNASHGFLSDLNYEKRSYFYRRGENKIGTLFYYTLSQFCLFFKLLKIIRGTRLTNTPVIVVNTMLPFGALLVSKLLKVKSIVYVHETSISPLPLKKMLRFIISHCATEIIYVSRFLSKLEPFSNKVKNHIIYNSVSPDYFDFFCDENRLHKKWDNGQVVMACSLKDYKGIPEFLTIAKQLNDSRLKFKLIVNDDDNAVANYFSGIVLPKNLDVISRPNKIITYYQDAFCVLNLSDKDRWIETFGLTLLEGMACYCPVVSPTIGGPVEIVDHEINGYCIDSKNTNLICEKLNFLSDNFPFWSSMALSAKEKSKFFSPSKFKSSILEIFQNEPC
ncbi:glycosyltransferase family 4 protein [Thalassotalea sp. G20_0]|uniref:glycosyltransferase family 4 protein n=1 Tax=Thalassotalea sp. G20_0 TaxID=2821093 RepID=UPI001ADD13EF|nr:glycosyltransferase family 4 protein [Thalassotalea sp. G20_0]MBO9497169.1 glycosyltransferase family 4 protein [Thalassotalea sp. G20_0]